MMKKQLSIFLQIVGAVTLLFFALILFNRSTAQTFAPATPPLKIKSPVGKFFDGYKITPGKVATWTGYAAAGALWGAREAYHADPHVFEKKWGVSEYSFFGSQAWQRNYQGNRYQSPDGGVNPHKGDLGNTFRDVHHFAGASHTLMVVGCTFGLAAGKQKLRHKFLDLGIGLIVRSAASWATYNYLRK